MYGHTEQRTFKEYFEERLEPFLQEKLVHVNRLDVVWDIYLENSLKLTTRQKHGDGSRKKWQLPQSCQEDKMHLCKIVKTKLLCFSLFQTTSNLIYSLDWSKRQWWQLTAKASIPLMVLNLLHSHFVIMRKGTTGLFFTVKVCQKRELTRQ